MIYLLTPCGKLHLFRNTHYRQCFILGWKSMQSNRPDKSFDTYRKPGKPLTTYGSARHYDGMFFDTFRFLCGLRRHIFTFDNGDRMIFFDKKDLHAFELGRSAYIEALWMTAPAYDRAKAAELAASGPKPFVPVARFRRADNSPQT